MVESLASRIVQWSRSRGAVTYSFTGGGPNACKVGSDGALYVTQNGGAVPGWESPDISRPAIQRVWPDGRCEELFASLDGTPFQYPNDLAFGRDGRLYFTDPPAWLPTQPGTGRIWVVDPRGRGELLEEVPVCFPNGIAGDADGTVVWVDSFERRVFRWTAGSGSVELCRLQPGHIPDGLDIDSEGNLWIASVYSGGVDVVSASGEPIDFVPIGGWPLNCTFWDTSLVVAVSGAEVRDQGALVSVDVGIGGTERYRGSLPSTEHPVGDGDDRHAR